jgi:serine protease Do
MRLNRPMLLSLGLLSLSLHAGPRATLSPEKRTNGTQSLGQIEPLLPGVRGAAARIVAEDGRALASAVWVAPDGYLLTKASETPELEKARVRWSGDHTAALREIRRLPAYDLVLAQAVGVKDVVYTDFSQEVPWPSYGHWLASPSFGGRELCIGVISAQPRAIPGLGPAMGIRMDEKPMKQGVRLLSIAEDSPAAAAGMEAGDILTRIAQETVKDVKTVHEIIRRHQPGDLVSIHYLRDGDAKTARVRLASRTRIMMNWEGEDFANGGISIRTDDFPRILQHDLPLGVQDMGSPLYDLEGHALGINIARVDRVTTFALPTSVFWSKIKPLIEADRHPSKALLPP